MLEFFRIKCLSSHHRVYIQPVTQNQYSTACIYIVMQPVVLMWFSSYYISYMIFCYILCIIIYIHFILLFFSVMNKTFIDVCGCLILQSTAFVMHWRSTQTSSWTDLVMTIVFFSDGCNKAILAKYVNYVHNEILDTTPKDELKLIRIM